MRRALCDMRLGGELEYMTYIEIGEWALMQNAAQAVRTNVFVHEQDIAPEDEWDADDATALHAVLFDLNGQALGNARLLQSTTNAISSMTKSLTQTLTAWQSLKSFTSRFTSLGCVYPRP
jgi:predicted GNAT family N-acyltransferase